MAKQYGPYVIQKNFSVITVPAEVRKQLDLKAGDNAMWVIDNNGNCILKKVKIQI